MYGISWILIQIIAFLHEQLFTNLTWTLHGTCRTKAFTPSKDRGAPGHTKRVLYQWFTKNRNYLL